MNALILVDLQNDFLPGGALAVPRGDEVVPLANRLQPHFDLVVATQDWHPAEHRSFAANHPGKREGEIVELQGLPQVLWPVHCVQHTPGADLAPSLDARRIAHVFQKGIVPNLDSYSGFYDNGQRRSTGLGEYLQAQGVTDVYVVGLATDYCVKATALDAMRLGFRTFVVADACRGVELHPGDVEAAIESMRRAGASITSSVEVEARSAKGCLPPGITTLGEGKFLRLVRAGRWEYVERTNVSGVVVMVPVTDQGEVVLVEQYRPATRSRNIELPAGLAGDVSGSETEALAAAAHRELLEETGFEAQHLTRLGNGASSAGLTSETVTFFLATGLRRVSEGGGDSTENIKVHVVPLAQVDHWLRDRENQGATVAVMLYAGLWLAKKK